jgi:hypothetical protein
MARHKDQWRWRFKVKLEGFRGLFGRMPRAEALDCATAADLDAVERWA